MSYFLFNYVPFADASISRSTEQFALVDGYELNTIKVRGSGLNLGVKIWGLWRYLELFPLCYVPSVDASISRSTEQFNLLDGYGLDTIVVRGSRLNLEGGQDLESMAIP